MVKFLAVNLQTAPAAACIHVFRARRVSLSEGRRRQSAARTSAKHNLWVGSFFMGKVVSPLCTDLTPSPRWKGALCKDSLFGFRSMKEIPLLMEPGNSFNNASSSSFSPRSFLSLTLSANWHKKMAAWGRGGRENTTGSFYVRVTFLH